MNETNDSTRLRPASSDQSRPHDYDKINLGCGEDYRDNWLNVDIRDEVEPDIVMDLDRTPWPFEDDSYEMVLMDNVFEHIEPNSRVDVVNELHRIMKTKGELVMRLPVPEVGIGWELTHHPIPSWRWPYHPRHSDQWTVEEINISKVGLGRLMPAPLAKLATRFWVTRAVDEVELRASPKSEGGYK